MKARAWASYGKSRDHAPGFVILFDTQRMQRRAESSDKGAACNYEPCSTRPISHTVMKSKRGTEQLGSTE